MPGKHHPPPRPKRKIKPPVVVIPPPIPPTVAIVTHDRVLFSSPTHRADEVCPLCDPYAPLYDLFRFRIGWPSPAALRMIKRRTEDEVRT